MQLQTALAPSSDALLDPFFAELLWAPSPDTIARLIDAADRLRRSMSAGEWRDLATGPLRRHRLAAMLRDDPYTRRALDKPRGYAGDAVMLDYLYDGIAELGARAAAIFAATTGGLSADAVRERRARIAQMIDEAAERHPAPTVVSLACGHARELELSTAMREGHVGRMVCIDQDGDSLKEVRARWCEDDVEIVCSSVKKILTGSYALPPADLITSAGLFDYLNDEIALALLRRLVAAARPGGRVVIANFASDSQERGYMEAFMDWWLIYRSEDQLRELAAAIPEPLTSVRTWRDDSSRVLYLEIVR